MIWWICSYPKSGNTWVRMFLSAYLHGDLNPNAPSGVMQDDIGGYGHQVVCPFPLDRIQGKELALLRPAYLLHMITLASASGAKEIFVKSHNFNAIFHDIPLFLPDLTHGVINVVRDPRDVAVSWAHHSDNDLDSAIEFMGREDAILRHDGRGPAHILGTWSQHIGSWIQPQSVLKRFVVRYEDLRADPEKHFGRMLVFLGKEVDAERLKTAIEASSFERLQAFEKTHGFRESAHGRTFFRSGKSGIWRNVLSAAQVRRIEADHGHMMKELGYGGDGQDSGAQRSRPFGNGQDVGNDPVQAGG